MSELVLPGIWTPPSVGDVLRDVRRRWWQIGEKAAREKEDTIVQAIGSPTQKGIHAYTNLAITTMNTDATCVIPANSLVLIGVHNSNTTTDPGVPTSVTDGTNTVAAAGVDASFWTSPIGRVSLFSWFDTAGRTATITANFGSSNANTMYVWTITNAATASWKDATNATGAAGTTALGITTTGTCAQADEVAVALFCYGSSVAVPTTFPIAGYTSLANVQNGTRTVSFLAEYKVGVTAGSTETSGGTLAANANVARIIVTYKGLAAAAAAGAKPLVVSQAVQRGAVR